MDLCDINLISSGLRFSSFLTTGLSFPFVLSPYYHCRLSIEEFG